MEIREAGPDDAETLCDLTATVWRSAYVDLLGEDVVEEHLAATNAPETMHENLAEHDLTAFVAGDPVVGEAVCTPADDDAVFYLTQLYVHPDHWGEGVGSALLERVETEAVQRDRERIALVVLDGNDRAREFYERRGYEFVQEREERITEDVTELRYEKQLPE